MIQVANIELTIYYTVYFQLIVAITSKLHVCVSTEEGHLATA